MGLRSWFIKQASLLLPLPQGGEPNGAEVPAPCTKAEKLLKEKVEAGLPAELGSVASGRSVRAEFLHALILKEQKSSTDGIQISDAEVDGELDFSYALLDRPLSFFRCHFRDRVRFGRCKLPAFDLVACDLDQGLWAASVEVAYSIDLEASNIRGGADLLGAAIGADLIGRGAQLSRDTEGVALHLGSAKVGGFVELAPTDFGGTRPKQRFETDGELRLRLATVGDSVVLTSAKLSPAEGPAITAEGLVVGANVTLVDAEVDGEINLIGATVGADANFTGATLKAESDALTLDGTKVTGNVILSGGFNAEGTVRLVGSDLGGLLECDDATFSRPGGVAFGLDQAKVRALKLQGVTFNGGVRLYRTSAEILEDDLGQGTTKLGSWASASPLVLTGFTVQRFAGNDAFDLRKRWLLKNDHFDPGTWRSLVELYRSHGREADARRAAVAGENDRLRRGGLRWWQTLGGWIFFAVIGHGYRPLRAGGWAATVVLAFALMVFYGDAHIVALKDALHPKPNSVIYALDVFLPIIDFGETKYWRVTGWLECAQWAAIALGWTLTTLFVAGFTRLVRT